MSKYKDILKSWVNKCGVDICRASNNPRITLCGMRHRSIRTVIDVGANTGQFAKYILGFFPDAAVYSFEPLPDAYSKLQEWAAGYVDNVRAYNLAIGDSRGTIQINAHTQHSPSSSILKSSDFMEKNYPQTQEQTQITVEIDTLDNALAPEMPSMQDEVLLKLDVQGYEDRVLRGAQAVLAKARSCIVEVSLENFYAGQAEFFDLYGQLHASGFRYAGNLSQSYADDGRVLYLDAVFKKH